MRIASCAVILLLLFGAGLSNLAASTDNGKPNLLLIVIDDLGHADLGIFGSEIPTPNIDALARNGVLLSSFYVAPTCSPTRAMLLSGVDHHQAGLGHMAEDLAPNQRGHPGYEGFLNFRVAALPELLRDAGYWTVMAGKWHLGLERETSPAARGFDRSFAQLHGGAGHFDDLPLVGPGKALFRENGRLVDYPAGEYSTRFYSDLLIDYLHAPERRARPFFAYLSFPAPHWPLQAPADAIARHAGRYAEGYDVLARERFEQQRALGLLPPGANGYETFPGHRPWTSLSSQEKAIEARKMAVYAAMVDEIDRAVGRVLDDLRASGELQRTFIFLMSDNGPEAHDMDIAFPEAAAWAAQCCDNSLDNIGAADSYTWLGLGWGRASGVPYRMYKGYTSEGGIRVPAIAYMPTQIERGRRSQALVTVMDVVPTMLELAGIVHSAPVYKDREILPLQGKSMLAHLRSESARVHAAAARFGWELYGKRAVRRGDWKLLWEPRPAGVDGWQLYDLGNDPTEVRDRRQEQPERLQELIGDWEDYVRRNGVILPSIVPPY